MVKLTDQDILPIIKTVGLAPGKAKNIIALSKILVEN
jgi:endonuclease III